MSFHVYYWQSLKARVTLFTLVIFLGCIWALSFYVSRMLRDDMQRVLGEAQFSTVSILATEVNHTLNDRLRALEKLATKLGPTFAADPAALQTFLADRPGFELLFNGGTFITRTDGIAIASLPLETKRLGVNYSDRDYMRAALRDGQTTIGRPVLGKMLLAPVIAMAAPIRNRQGQVTGVLVGVTNLNSPNFLDHFTTHRYGKTGGYLIVSPRDRLVVTATDKKFVMAALPAPAPAVPGSTSRFIQGYEGHDVVVNQLGEQVLASAKSIPAAGWFIAASLPTEEAFAPIHDMQQRMLLATVLLTLLAGALTWWMLRRQLAPLQVTARALALMADKDHPLHALPITRPDEIGQLIDDFNQLLEALAQRNQLLSESEQRFRNMADAAPVLIWCAGVDTLCYYFNQMWLDFTGRNMAQERGNGWTEGIHPEDFQHCLETYVTAFDARQKFAMEYRLRRADGTYRWLLDHGVPRYDEQGLFLGYIGSCIDITDRKTVKVRLEQALITAEAATRAKSEFLAHMSHEIRTPMNAIIGAARLLAYEPLTPRQRGYTHVMSQSSLSLLALIDDILDLSKIEAGHIQLETAPFELAQIMTGLAGMAAVSAHGRNIKTSFELAPDVPARLLGDAFRLEQVLSNLLSNALKFTERGEITLRVALVTSSAEQIRLRFTLSDTGIGIAPEKLDAIFEAFVQAESTTTRSYGGTGLGLAICRKLVALMGGQMKVSSVPGQGSCFSFTADFQWPASNASEPICLIERRWNEHESCLPLVSSLAGRRVLMVEDNEFNRQVLEGILQHFGIEVDVAVDGLDGVECFQMGSPYDAILMDVHLPGLDGFACTRAIRALPDGAQVPIIAVTANMLPTTAAECRAAGMNDYMVKPLEPEALHRLLSYWILRKNPLPPVKTPLPATDLADALPAALPGIDLAKAAPWAHGSTRALAKLLARMLAHCGNDPQTLAQHILAGKLDAAAQLTHDLMGAAATVGASALVAAAQQLDHALRAGQPDSPPAQEALARITLEFAHLNAALRILQPVESW